MRLKRLSVTNFRGIAHLELTFPETAQTTVLVGINGAGKSSVLDAIALALIHVKADRQARTCSPRTSEWVNPTSAWRRPRTWR